MKTTKQINLVIATAAILFTLLGTACTKSTPKPNSVTGVKLVAAATSLGNVIADNNGLSLYFYANDVAGVATCVDGQCAMTWLPFYKADPSIGDGLAKADFGEITWANGTTRQTTYKGWPLYYNKNDKTSGDTKGDAVGGLWAVAKADYSVMLGNGPLIGSDGKYYNENSIEITPATTSYNYITDDYGRSLYQFANDGKNINNLQNAGSVAGAWPVLGLSIIKYVPTALVATPSNFNVFQYNNTTSANRQGSFKNHPMYYFINDDPTTTNSKRGSTKGVNQGTQSGSPGLWKILNNNTPVLN